MVIWNVLVFLLNIILFRDNASLCIHLSLKTKQLSLSILSSASISVFYFNFEPLLHMKYMQIHIEAFPQSSRYVKYISFATLVTALGA